MGDVSTHWGDCWRAHHDCAVVKVGRLEKVLEDIRQDEGWHRSLCGCSICEELGPHHPGQEGP